MNSIAQSFTMFLVGAVTLRITITGEYARYVKEGLRPFLFVAAAILVIAALTTLIQDLRSGSDEDGAPDHDGHGHGHRGPRVAWLLVLPVAAIFVVAPPALGSDAAERSASAAIELDEGFVALPKGGPVKLGHMDYAMRAWSKNGESLKGSTVRLTGFLSPRPAGGFYLTRMMLSCCAADGRPIKIGLEGDLPRDLKADDWVQIDGEYTPKVDRNEATRENIVFIKVTRHQRVTAPEMPYE